MSRRAILEAFAYGAATRRATLHVWAVLSLTVVAASASMALVGVFGGGEDERPRLVEEVVPAGAWQVAWTEGVLPPSAEQRRQVRALSGVAAGVVGMIAMLCLMIAAMLWRQRLRLRRSEDYVHWAVGARRAQLAARVTGEGWPWGVSVAVTAMGAGWLLPVLVSRTFPGPTEVPPQLAAASIVVVAVAVVIARWEGSAGVASARGSARPAILTSPVAVAVVGFAVLTGVGSARAARPGMGPCLEGAGPSGRERLVGGCAAGWEGWGPRRMERAAPERRSRDRRRGLEADGTRGRLPRYRR